MGSQKSIGLVLPFFSTCYETVASYMKRGLEAAGLNADVVPDTRQVSHFYYMNLYSGMKRAFERVNWRVSIIPQPRDPERSDIFERLHLDVILTINGSCPGPTRLKRGAIHIRWIQDHSFAGDYLVDWKVLAGDLVYFCTDNQRAQFRAADQIRARVLPFAVDQSVFGPGHLQKRPTDVSVVGFIGSYSVGDGMIQFAGKRLVIADYAKLYLATWQNLPGDAFDILAVESVVDRWLGENGISSEQYADAPPWVRALLDDEIPRSINRWLVVRELLSATAKIDIYGPPAWATWPDMKQYYRNPVIGVTALVAAFRDAKISLHNGGYLGHPRMLEGMACGAVMLANADAYNDDYGGRAGRIAPWTHFVPYKRSTLSETVKSLLADPGLLNAISTSGAALVREHHTWDHRVAQILEDLAARGNF